MTRRSRSTLCSSPLGVHQARGIGNPLHVSEHDGSAYGGLNSAQVHATARRRGRSHLCF